MKNILFSCLLLISSKAGFCQADIHQTYKITTLDGFSDMRQAIAGRSSETEKYINLTCTDSRNNSQKILLSFTEKETKEVVLIRPNSTAIAIMLPLKEYDSYYSKLNQIFFKKEMRGAISINVLSGTSTATFYYYLTGN